MSCSDPLELDEVLTFATDWGRWLLDQEGCWPAGAGCVSLESGYKSPQRWTDDVPIFSVPANVHRAAAFERIATQSGVLSPIEKRVLDTHYVHLSWWRLTEWGVLPGIWMRRRVEKSGTNGLADYMALLEGAHNIMGRQLAPFATLL